MTSDIADTLIERWTAMWNRMVHATAVVTADARVDFGRQPVAARLTTTTTAAELQQAVDAIGDAIPGIHYGHRSPPLTTAGADERAGLITLLWEVEAPGAGVRSGIDLLRYADGLIVEVWSITGDLELPPLSDEALATS